MPLHRSPLRRSVFKCQIASEELCTADVVTDVAEQKTSSPPASSSGRSESLAATVRRSALRPCVANRFINNRNPSIQASYTSSGDFADSSNCFDLNAYNTYSNCVMGLCNRSRISETFPIE